MTQAADFLDSTTAARLLGVAPSTLRAWSRRGRIRAWRTSGGRYLYRRVDILGLLPKLIVNEEGKAP